MIKNTEMIITEINKTLLGRVNKRLKTESLEIKYIPAGSKKRGIKK